MVLRCGIARYAVNNRAAGKWDADERRETRIGTDDPPGGPSGAVKAPPAFIRVSLRFSVDVPCLTAGGSFRFLGAAHLEGALAAHPVAVSLAKIESWWRLTLDRSPGAAIGSILERTGLVPLAAASPLGATMAGRLLQLVEMARRAGELGKADFPSAVEWLNSAIEADVEPLSILAGRADLVRIMNLHRAKGLEAPIVILTAPYKAKPHSPDCHVDRFGEKEPSAWFQVTRKTGEYTSKVVAQPPGWEEKQAVEQEYQEAEESRLRYVAATRARQLLIISDAPGIKSGTSPWDELLSDSVVELPMDDIDLSVQDRPKVKVKSSTCARDLQTVTDAMASIIRCIQPGA